MKLELCDIEPKEIGVDIFLHSQRVAMYTQKLAQNMNYNSKQISYLVRAAINHDIGKCFVPKKILHKEGKLMRNEFEEIKKHTQYSADILGDLENFRDLSNTVKMHHENYDGSGYYNISGDKIPIASRIIRITDVYDALVSDRCYRKSYTKEEALRIMESEKHKYDQNILEQFFRMIERETAGGHAF